VNTLHAFTWITTCFDPGETLEIPLQAKYGDYEQSRWLHLALYLAFATWTLL
jgi:hypothetical protein